jgi:hypothetical protein
MRGSSLVFVVLFAVLVLCAIGTFFVPPTTTLYKLLWTIIIADLVAFLVLMAWPGEGAAFRSALRRASKNRVFSRKKDRSGTKIRTAPYVHRAPADKPRAPRDEGPAEPIAADAEPIAADADPNGADLDDEESARRENQKMYNRRGQTLRFQDEMAQRFHTQGDKIHELLKSREEFAKDLNAGRLRADDYMVKVDSR